MRMPNASMSSQRLILLGRYHVGSLEQTEETRPLAPVMAPTVETLETATAATASARLGLVGPRVAVAFGEAELEQVLRNASLRAQQLDNKVNGGPVKIALFPGGLVAALRPRGAAQVEAAVAVRERLVTQPVAAPLREELLPGLDAAIADQRARLAARDAAYQAYASAFAVELGARESFITAYSSSAGAIRQIFPRNRERQDLYFDEVYARGRSEEPPVEDDDGDDGPTT